MALDDFCCHLKAVWFSCSLRHLDYLAFQHFDFVSVLDEGYSRNAYFTMGELRIWLVVYKLSRASRFLDNVRYALEPVRNIPDNWKTWIFEYSRLKIERPFEFDATIYFLLYIFFFYSETTPLPRGKHQLGTNVCV